MIKLKKTIYFIFALTFISSFTEAQKNSKKIQEENPGLHLGEEQYFTGGDFNIKVEVIEKNIKITIPEIDSDHFVIYRDSKGDGLFKKHAIIKENVWIDENVSQGNYSYVVLSLKREKNTWIKKHSFPASVLLQTGEGQNSNAENIQSDVTVIFSSTPSSALIILDNKNLGFTPVTLKLKPGIYSLSVSKEGFIPFKTSSFVVSSALTGRTLKTNIILQQITGGLNIETVPSDATIFIDDVQIGKSPVQIKNLKTGLYLIKAVKEGYLTLEKKINITSTEIQSLVFNLSKEAGAIKVISEPTGATVLCDNIMIGVTPVLITNLSTGFHLIRVTKDEYNESEVTVNVEPKTTKEVSLILNPGNASLSIYTTPDKAECFVDNIKIGVSPVINYSITKNSHRLLVRKQGYKEYEEIFEAKAGQNIQRHLVLTPLKATLSILSVPDKAKVDINGTEMGLTPFISENIQPGNLTIILSKEGYANLTNRVIINSGSRKDLFLTLKPLIQTPAIPPSSKEGFLSISSEPSQAEVKINDRYFGLTPLIISLMPGIYNIKVSKSGYETWDSQVEVQEGKVKEIRCVLENIFCSLSIKSDPQDAEVSVNNTTVGKSPLTIQIKPGTWLLTVKKDGYIPVSETLTVSEKDKEMERVFVLTQIKKTFSFYSTPQGAYVFINNKSVGITPFQISFLPDGTYNILFHLEGYRDSSYTVTVKNGEPNSFYSKLQPFSGNLLVITDPKDSQIFIDSARAGVSDTLIRNIIAGYHKISVKKFGYYDYNYEVLIKDNETLTNRINLKEKPKGKISITSIPSGASVTIDDRFIGVTPVTVEWPEGEYTVKLKKKRYITSYSKVIVREEDTTKLDIPLKEGSDCCLCNTWLGKPLLWYISSAVSFGVAGYSWYMQDKAKTSSEKRDFINLRDTMAVIGTGCLFIGITAELTR